MIANMDLAILIGALLVVVAVFTSLVSFRLGAPLLLVFLGIGILAGVDGIGHIPFDNLGAAYFIGQVALALILFDAGFETRLSTVRGAGLQALLLATFGVLLSALVVSLAARLLFGLSWVESLLLGAIVSPTDAAAVFLLLRTGGIVLRDRVRATLELESGANDPMAIFLTLALTGILAAPSSAGHALGDIVLDFTAQIGLGGLLGLGGGALMVRIMRRAAFEPGLYPIIVLAMALALFALSGLVGGSGFLAVYLAGIALGNARIPQSGAIRRFNNGITWLAQIAMFLLLGMLASPSQFGPVLIPSILLALVLIVLARPLAVWLCLSAFGFTRQEMAFISWVGIRGAVSILLAILPRLNGLAGGGIIFNAAFIVVLASLLVQGWTIRPLARWLRLIVPSRGPVQRIELGLPGKGDHEVVAYDVHPESPVGKGERAPRWARPALILREGHSLKPHSAGRPRPGDKVFIVAAASQLRLLDQLFAGPLRDGDPALYGEFGMAPEALLSDIAAVYGATFAAEDAPMTVRAFLRRQLAGDIEPGDRVSLGPVDVIVRKIGEDHQIEEIGLSVEPVAQVRPQIPLFHTPAELAVLLREALRRRRERREKPQA